MAFTRQGLVDYALRKLGAPVVNIEVDAAQIEDCISDALHQYTETHFDGIVRDYLVHKISGTTINVVDGSQFKKNDTIISIDGLTRALVFSVVGNVIVINRQHGYDKFVVNQAVKNIDLTTSTSIVSIVLGDIDNGWITAADNIVGVTKILNITTVLGSADYMFNVQYQIMMSEMQALTKSGVSSFWQTMNYLGHLDFIMKKEQNFTFHRRMNRLFLEVAWGTDIKVGQIVVAEIYRAVDAESYPEIYDDIWVKRYVTALLKKQWGMNLSKYTGLQLPGGLTYNGRQIYDDAVADIKVLEDEALYSSAPLDFFVG